MSILNSPVVAFPIQPLAHLQPHRNSFHQKLITHGASKLAACLSRVTEQFKLKDMTEGYLIQLQK